MMKGRMVVLALFLSLFFSQGVMGQGLDEAKRLNQKAGELYGQGRYEEAINYVKRSLEIREKALGREHPDVAQSLNNLAELYRNAGRYSDAEPLYKRALEIKEKILGREHPSVVASINNLALLYYSTGRYSDAEPLHKRALEIREKALGREHPDVAASLNNLALLYESTGRYSDAEPLYKRAIEIHEKALGNEHPDVAGSLNNLALLYDSTGRYVEAEPLYKKALEIYEKALGKEHPNVATSLSNLAFLYASTDKHIESHNFFKRGISIKDLMRENVFLLLNEREKIGYMNQNEYSIHAFMFHTVKYMQFPDKDPASSAGQAIRGQVPDKDIRGQAITDTFNSWLKWKGAVLEAQGRYMDAAMQSKDPEIRKRFNELLNIRRELAKMQLSKHKDGSFEAHRNRITELERQKEGLEANLSRLSKDFALEKQAGNADVQSITKLLPRDSVYIDFARINSYNFKNNKWEKPEYLAFILLPDRDIRGQVPQEKPEVRLIEIGKTEDIERHIGAYLQEMNKIKSGKIPAQEILNRKASDIYDIVLKPLEPYIKDRKQLFISPDGNLNLLPFESLVPSDGRYLIEDYSISYISAGRDIIRFSDTTIAKGDAIIIA
ncbi:MAG: tetratricopeptide repeat protein, partial [Nitrospinae bacterium]|nr:tetratricopeptide repeat protein [Nitrospinota bacterium]